SHTQEIDRTPIEPARPAELLALDMGVLDRVDEGGRASRKIREEFNGLKRLRHRVDIEGHSGREPIRNRVSNGQSGAGDPAVELLERTGCLVVRKIQGRAEHGRLLSIELVPVQRESQSSSDRHDQARETERIDTRNKSRAAAPARVAPQIDT